MCVGCSQTRAGVPQQADSVCEAPTPKSQSHLEKVSSPSGYTADLGPEKACPAGWGAACQEHLPEAVVGKRWSSLRLNPQERGWVADALSGAGRMSPLASAKDNRYWPPLAPGTLGPDTLLLILQRTRNESQKW